MSATLEDHLATGATTLCLAWAIARADGVTLGFTDHDRDLAFEGVSFRAATGLSARVLQMTTGLAADNSEAVGALSSDAIREEDIIAGRYDGAEVRVWRVNWADPALRRLQFRGSIGEIVRSGPTFRAELRGLTDQLNRPQGRIFHRECAAVLGDGECRVDLAAPGLRHEGEVLAAGDNRRIELASPAAAEGWFERGRLRVLDGRAAGLVGAIRADRVRGALREIELFEALKADLRPGDRVVIEAGCDRTARTCRTKFANFLNFRGFPHIPGEDWLAAYPAQGRRMEGGSLFGGSE